MNNRRAGDCRFLSRKITAVIIFGLLIIGFMPEIVGLLESVK
jgi:hypothetical protein